MIVYFADRMLNVIATASTNLPGGLQIQDDKLTRRIEGDADSFDCTISAGDTPLTEIEKTIFPCNNILVEDKREILLFSILDTDFASDTREITIYAESGGLDLLNDMVTNLSGSGATIQSYVNRTIDGTGWEIGINEIPTLTRTLSYDSEDTVISRLQKIAGEFDAELSYSVEMDRMTVTRRLVNIHERRGKEVGASLRTGREIEKITVKRSAAELATAILPICPDASLPSYDDGDMYVRGGILYSREALSTWARATGNHIVLAYQSEAKTAQSLLDAAKKMLNKSRVLQTTYEVELAYLPEGIEIGDTISLVDEADGIFLQARVMVLETSETNGTRRVTLGDISEETDETI